MGGGTELCKAKRLYMRVLTVNGFSIHNFRLEWKNPSKTWIKFRPSYVSQSPRSQITHRKVKFPYASQSQDYTKTNTSVKCFVRQGVGRPPEGRHRTLEVAIEKAKVKTFVSFLAL